MQLCGTLVEFPTSELSLCSRLRSALNQSFAVGVYQSFLSFRLCELDCNDFATVCTYLQTFYSNRSQSYYTLQKGGRV